MESPATGPTAGLSACSDTEKPLPEALVAPFRQTPQQRERSRLRTLTGARQFCAIRSYLSTAAKHDLSFLNVLVMLTEGRPWIPSAA